MAETAFKEKITKGKFQEKLFNDFGHDNISAAPYGENGLDADGFPIVNSMTLYYNESVDTRSPNGQHIATWMKGEGWIFEHAYQN